MDEKKVQKQERSAISHSERTRCGKVFVPATDIIETENEILLLSEMPGVNEKFLDVVLENNQLTIQGCINPVEDNEHELVYSEYETGDFYRSFTINDSIDRDKIKARLKNGLLELVLPKSEKIKPRQISVELE